jgi:lipopolysaccharide/colanic/teichoic acid biosynthesis glycosyltransferase
MRLLLPSSHGSFRVRLSAFDVFWAALSPLLALYVRDAYVLSPKFAATAALYCGISLVFSLIAFLAFRLSDGNSHHFSVQDAANVVKAVFSAGFMTALVLFTFTRLDGIPRTTPILHVFILISGLIAMRAITRFRDSDHTVVNGATHSQIEHIIMIGATRLSSLYIKFVRAYSPLNHRIVAVLDEKAKMIGRAIIGVPVIAKIQNIEPVIEEFAVHGVRIHRLIIGGDEHLLSEEALAKVRHVCDQRQIKLQFVPDLIGLDRFPAIQNDIAADIVAHPPSVMTLPAYHRVKRVIDFIIAATTILVLLPLFVAVSLLVLLDVGSPVVFWQQRIGQGGGCFLLYKFRTLQTPFDSDGRPLANVQRLSWIGRILRGTRLDELPQLFNVLVGDMSLIGPRPLLLHDQPTNSTLRLSARPGITGWAQVNGGNLITANEKGALDEWYIRNASPWLDLRILGLTLRFGFTGERRSEHALSQAHAEQNASYSWMVPPHPRQGVREVLKPAHTRRPASRATRGTRPPAAHLTAVPVKPHQ